MSIEPLTDLAKETMRTLPPSFVLLLFINVLFLGTVLWFVDHQSNARVAAVNRVLDACLAMHATALTARPAQ